MQNSGATLVCELRLGDQVWSHGDNLGIVVMLELLADPRSGPARPRMQVTTIGGELGDGRRVTHTFLCIDRVHVGSSYVTASTERERAHQQGGMTLTDWRRAMLHQPEVSR